MSREKIVLAYSGGLDTSVAIKWFQQRYNYDVIAVIADLGEGKDLTAVKQKALDIGAIDCIAFDVKNIFAETILTKTLQANALYQGKYPLISALSRPLIAKLLVDTAAKTGATSVAHGCTGKGNDQVRFDVAIKSLNPALKIVAPVRESPMSREEAIQYAEKNNIPLPIQLNNPFSIDQNLWGRSCECGVLEDPWVEPPEAAFDWTRAIDDTPNDATEITLSFQSGLPVALDQKKLSLVHIIEQLNHLGGEHGIGRIDHVEDRLIGIKSREIYEAPAATILIQAHQALESLTLPREVLQFKPLLEQKFANGVYEGLWYSPLQDAINAFMSSTQATVSGDVRLKFHKGSSRVVGRRSNYSLYQHHLATYNPDDQFDHHAALGFIQLWGLPTEVFHHVQRSHHKGS
jgi:argininosuccinate synthase